MAAVATRSPWTAPGLGAPTAPERAQAGVGSALDPSSTVTLTPRALVTSLTMRSRGLNPRILLALLVLVVVAGGVAVLLIGGSSNRQATGAVSGHGRFRAAEVFSPPSPAPPLALHNYLGQPVNIASYRGRAVLVTFLYTNCPDVCPLITASLHSSLELLGSRSSQAQIIAVSVDPRGDTTKAVAAFLARHRMTGRMLYLTGTAHELAHVWKAWGVGSERDVQQPQFVNHSGLVYGISASGKRSTIYASNFIPAELAHDVPLLAAR
jgi:protein SCO1/2